MQPPGTHTHPESSRIVVVAVAMGDKVLDTDDLGARVRSYALETARKSLQATEADPLPGQVKPTCHSHTMTAAAASV